MSFDVLGPVLAVLVIFAALLEVMADDGIAIRGLYERNDAATRKLEGLEQTAGWFAGAAGGNRPPFGAVRRE